MPTAVVVLSSWAAGRGAGSHTELDAKGRDVRGGVDKVFPGVEFRRRGPFGVGSPQPMVGVNKSRPSRPPPDLV